MVVYKQFGICENANIWGNETKPMNKASMDFPKSSLKKPL